MYPFKRFLLMLALTAMRSPSFLFIKLAVQEMPTLTVVSLRVTLAAIILYGVLLMKRDVLPTDFSFWLRTAGMALFSSLIPFCLFCYAEKSIDSALAAILNGTTPMFTALLAQLFVASDRMNLQKMVGILLCSIGVLLLFVSQISHGVNGTSLGMSAALLAAFSYSVSHVYGKLFFIGQKPFVAPTAQFIACAAIIWPFTLWHDQVWALSMPSWPAIGGVFGLALFGTACAFIIYYKLLDYCGPTAVSMVACFFPVGGMLLGFLFLGETFTLEGLLAAGIILLGMLTVNQVISLDFLKAKKEKLTIHAD